MARENHLWGAEKIVGELLKLGITVGKPTVQKYMEQVRKRMGGQSWATFLRNHAREVWACDFTVSHDLLFRPIYTFVIIAHHSREIVHSAVTRHPTDAWVAQQLREATPWNRKPRFLIRDNDKKFGKQFATVARSSGIKELLTPLKSPRANGKIERWHQTLKQECIRPGTPLSPNDADHLVDSFVDQYNHHRLHSAIGYIAPGDKLQRRETEIFAQRQQKLTLARQQHQLFWEQSEATPHH